MEWSPWQQLIHTLGTDGWRDVIQPHIDEQKKIHTEFLTHGNCTSLEEMHYTRGFLQALDVVASLRAVLEADVEGL